MRPDICLYHGPHCPDGFSAAFAVWKRWADAVQFIPVDYDKPAPDVAGKDVLMVDFAYRQPDLIAMSRSAKTITIIDHHASAQRDLEDYAVYNPVDYSNIDAIVSATQPGLGNIRAIFNMQRSGATMTWSFCHHGRTPSPFLLYVEDGDLGRYKLEYSREINAAIKSYNFDFLTWSALDTRFRNGDITPIISEGKTINRAFQKQLTAALETCTRFMVIGGHRVPVANLPPAMAPEGARKLAEGQLFAASYYDRSDGRRVFSLHSRDGFDVSEIATAYGGGGHADAAGFRSSLNWNGDVE